MDPSYGEQPDITGDYYPEPLMKERVEHCYGAIDLGTNNCRLLIAKPAWKNFIVLDAFSKLVRLGEDLDASGVISKEAADRTIEALKVCAEHIAEKKVTKGKYIATEACRVAKNGAEFIARIFEETGLQFEAISHEQEAYYSASGCIPLADPQAKSVLLFDIGGGSTEIIWVGERPFVQGRYKPEIRAWTSLPIGVVTLSERFGGKAITEDVFDAMVELTIDEIAKFPAAREIRANSEGMHLLGSSGTITTIAAVHLGLPRYIRKRVDGMWLSSLQIDGVVDWLRDTSIETRAAQPCIGVERADLILAGCAILEGIRQLAPDARMRVADRGVREGILTEMMAQDGVWSHRNPQDY